MIDDVYKHNKKELLYIASALHKSIRLGIKVSEVCLMWNPTLLFSSLLTQESFVRLHDLLL